MRARFAVVPMIAIMLGSSLWAAAPQRLRAQAAAPAAPSADDEEKARGHFRLGRAYYDNGDFAEAAVEFESAYRISQRAALLYNIYLAYRDANDTRHAYEALKKYLQLEQKVENRGQLESRLAALERSLQNAPAAGPTPTPAVAATAAASAAQPTAAGQPAAVQPTAATPNEVSAPAEATAPTSEQAAIAGPSQTLPIVLMAGGGALIVGSVITGVMTLGKHSALSDASDACKKAGDCESLPPARVAELNSDRSSGKTLALVTDVLLFGGLAVAGTGAVLFLLNNGKAEQKPSATTASLACAPGACIGMLRTRF